MKKHMGTILGALVIALTGLIGLVVPYKVFQVQEERLLWNVKEIPFENVETEDAVECVDLKEEEYGKIIHSINRGGTTYYHEPVQGQINMSKAIDLAIEAFNKLLGREQLSINNFINIKAVLQTKVEKYETKPQYSYWNIQMSNEKESIHVWMNSVSGKILKMDVNLYDEQDMDLIDLKSLLEVYVSYSGFHMQQMEEETANVYKTAFDRVYKGPYFNCYAVKAQCTSPEQLDYHYINIVLGIENN
nr:hypothetical protein [uncultured Lachnoclostridium sp.]